MLSTKPLKLMKQKKKTCLYLLAVSALWNQLLLLLDVPVNQMEAFCFFFLLSHHQIIASI